MTVYYKMRQIYLQNATAILLRNALGFLLQNVTVLLQNATVFTNYNDFITKCNSYYKMQRLLQIATVQNMKTMISGNIKRLVGLLVKARPPLNIVKIMLFYELIFLKSLTCKSMTQRYEETII